MSHSIKTRFFGALLGLSVCVNHGLAGLAQTSVPVHQETITLVMPARRTPDPAPGPPPTLPPGADTLKALTLDAVLRVTRVGRSQTVRQTITRTADRIHVASSDGREWLFERNPVDPRRVSALLIEHDARAIVRYEESDLRMVLLIRGWADVLWLGFDPVLLKGLSPTTETRSLGGIQFVRYAAHRETGDVWWSDDQAFASSFVIADKDGSTRFFIEHIRPGVDGDRLRPPPMRFPAYRVFDLAEWLERH